MSPLQSGPVHALLYPNPTWTSKATLYTRTQALILNSAWSTRKAMGWHFKSNTLAPREECEPTIPAFTDLFKVLCAAGW